MHAIHRGFDTKLIMATAKKKQPEKREKEKNNIRVYNFPLSWIHENLTVPFSHSLSDSHTVYFAKADAFKIYNPSFPEYFIPRVQHSLRLFLHEAKNSMLNLQSAFNQIEMTRIAFTFKHISIEWRSACKLSKMPSSSSSRTMPDHPYLF